MADHSKNLLPNVPGRYFVDRRCICCGICTVFAPAFFKVDLEREVGYVSRQPGSGDEERAVKQAMSNCPVQAIGIRGGLS